MAALIEADALGQLRTGAASGVATKYLANANARTACIIGTGYQARTQLEAVAAVRRLERVRAFGRDPERREKFCREMSERIGVAVEPMNSGEEAVKGADIIITATSATKVVLEGAWLAPGMHINAMGANWPQKRELDAAAVARADKIVVDSIEQSKMEAGDLIQAFGEDQSRWNAVQELSQIVAGKDARQKRHRSNHIVQIEWHRNLGSGGRRARVRNGSRARHGQTNSPLAIRKTSGMILVAQASACGVLSLHGTKPHRLKPAPLNPFFLQQMLRPSQDKAARQECRAALASSP